jgi:hypothetical protein
VSTADARTARYAARLAIHAKIAELALAPRALAIPDFDGRTVHLVSRDMARPGWRVTRLDDRGPPGDSHAESFERVLDIAREYGDDMLRAVAVTPETVDAVAEGLGIVVMAELLKDVV